MNTHRHPTRCFLLRRTLVSAFVLSVALSACGGGSDSEDSDSIDPYGVYQRIGYGMSYETVKGMLGGDFNGRKFEGNGWTSYSWVFGQESDAKTEVSVTIHQEGVTSKHIKSRQVDRSFYWI